MGTLTVVEKGADCQDAIDYPLFYMNDFSHLGLRVESLARALEALEAAGYPVDRKRCSASVDFGTSSSGLRLCLSFVGGVVAFLGAGALSAGAGAALFGAGLTSSVGRSSVSGVVAARSGTGAPVLLPTMV